MKSTLFIRYLLIISIQFLLFACKDEASIEAISNVTVSVTMPKDIKDSIYFANRIVTLRSDRMVYTAETNDLGQAEFSNIIPDIYSIYTSWDLSGDEYVQMANTLVENKPALINGLSSKINIFSEMSVELKTLLSVKQNLLISKVYASGTRDINNSSYIADAYVEIFNNSEEIQFLDGIYLALVEGDYPIGFPAYDFPTTLHARQVYQFPGTGTDYKVLPGKSIVIANSARNHTFVAPTSVNLQYADFEFKGDKYPNIDTIPGMIQIYSSYISIKEINLQKGGVNSLFLFKSEDDVSNYPLDYIPGKTSGNRFIRITAENVIDGVEILGFKSTGVDVNSKRLQNFIDAGYKTITSTGGLNHESIERKVDTQKSTANRVYLRDTNNSQTDWVVINEPSPKVYNKSLLLQ